MPYSSDIQIVNDANGAAHAFLANNGLLWECQWNAEAQRWDQGQVVPGSEGARGLQALVVDDLWPSSGATGAVPGNAQGIVLAYRIGNGASSQVVASFGAWDSNGSLSWTQALPLSSQQGNDEAFALVPSAAGTLRLVLQKREATASPQELLAQFSENPSELLNKQLDGLASGARKDSDLYVSDLQINSTGNGGYALQLSAPGASPNSQTTALTPATPTPRPATPALAFGGNTQLSRAALAANPAPNAAPIQGLQRAGRLTAEPPALLGAGALGAITPVAFAQPAAASGGGLGFGFTNYIRNPASLASLALYPVRYSLGTALGQQNNSYYAGLGNDNNNENLASSFIGSFVDADSRSVSRTSSLANLATNPPGAFLGNSEVDTILIDAEKIAVIKPGVLAGINAQPAGLVGGSAEQAANQIYANPAQREFTLSGAYGGLLAGRGGYSVVNFSTFRYGTPALDSSQAANSDTYRKLNLLLSGRPETGASDQILGGGYSPGWKFGQGLAGSFKTLFQYSSPTSVGGATKLIGFNAQQSLGWNLLAHKAKYFDSGARFSLDLSLIAGFVMEQRYASADGLSRPLADTGLAVGALGDALSLFQKGQGIFAVGVGLGFASRDFSPQQTNGLFINNGKNEPGQAQRIRYAATAGGLASLGLAVGIPVGVGASQMNADGTYSFGLGLQENVRARLLSKYGVGLEVIAGSQQNLLWTIGEGFANPSLQVLAFASAGAALPLGAFVPIIPNLSWNYESNPPSTVAAARSAAAPAVAAPGDLGGPNPFVASSTPPVSRGTYIVTPTGRAYPMGYLPASATDALLALPKGPIASLLDAPATLEWHQLRSFSASQLSSGLLEWSKNNTFVGLNDGTYTNVALVGLGLPGSAPATASFTASGGVISNLVVQGARSLSLSGWISDGVLTLQASSDPGLQNGDVVTGAGVTALALPGPLLISGLAVAYDASSQLVSYRLNQGVSLGDSSNLKPIAVETTQGQYLALPEPKSGRYVFGLDVFQAQSGNPAPPAVSSAGSVLDGMPLFSLQTATGSNNSPLSTANIQRIQAQLPISALSQGNTYPKADGSFPASNDYSVYSYSKVPIALLRNDGSGTPITPLNPDVTATVKLSAGLIVDVSLDQPLYFPLAASAYAGLPYTLVVDVEQALGNPGLVNPTVTVSAQQEALNNFTDQESFSANASIHNAGVFLSSGVSDQLPLLASYGRLPVQNRVSYVDGDTVVYLNNTGGSSASWQAVSSSQLTLEAIYNQPGSYQFTAASNPTAITDTASNTTFVFWVEASEPVIPLAGSDGVANYQAFMNALYGHQRINYSYATTSQAGTNTKWNYVNVNDLYAPADTLITDLRSFVVQVDGVQRSLLVWTEVPISALKNAEANPQVLIDSQLAVIKVGLINPNAAFTPSGYTWDALFNDASGHSTIATIPWNSDRGSGLSIADLSAATLQLQVEPVARFSGTIFGTTLTVGQLSSGSLAVGDLILGAGVQAGTTVTAVTRAATASRAGSYQVNTSQTVNSTNLEAVPLSADTTSGAIAFAGSFSGSGNTTLTLSSGASNLQVGDQLLGVGLEPGTFITAVLSRSAGSGADSFAINHGPASGTATGSAALLALPAGTPSPKTSQTLSTPVLSWSEAVRTPYNEAVLASAPLLFVPMAGLQPGINSLNLGTSSTNTETFVSSTGLNTSIAGALPKSSASAVENVQGLGVLATGLGSINSATLDVLRNTPQTPAIPADSPVAIFNGAINRTILRISSVSQGILAVGELLVGEGIPAGTTIAALPHSTNADQSGDYILAYASGADSGTVLAATTLRTLPQTGGLPLVSFAGSFSGAGGANGYTTLNITDLSDPLQVGDQVLGLGLPGGSTILQVVSLDLNSGNAQVIVSQGPQTNSGSYGLASSSGGSSSPYTIEFWTQLDPDSNPAGAGLVALGQPTGTALPDRPVELPEGWLLSSSFGVERLTWQAALNLSLETSLDGNNASDFYGWRWALVADGTNTTAMDGRGGNNLYRNALLLNNLLVGDTIEGVNSFLAAYGISSSDLIGFDGTPADQIASSPTTQFQFSSAFSPNQALGGEAVPTTSLNGVAIDTSTAEMNGGIVLAAQADANANLNAMFQNLWNFEQTYGQTKVNFSLNPLTQPVPPVPSNPATPPSANRIEQYGGYQLQFVLQPGPAVSVNAMGQIAFDVAPGVTLVSADGVDYRDNGWHYVAASFLPDYFTYSAAGTALELPRNVGTANLYVNGKLVATQANVINAYTASNFNDAAVLLSDNAGGAIDLLAIYGQALTTSQPPAVATDWPLPTSTEALALLKEAGFLVASKTPNPGQQPGAVSNHYLAHTVDPNNAAKSTFTSVLLPDAKGGLSWSEASTLNPEAAITSSTASASSPSLQSALLLPIAAGAWGQNGWYTNAAPSTAVVANPAGRTLKAISVTLTPVGGGTVVTRQLSPEEVLMGASTLAALQPSARDANFAYTFLSNQPALNLLITRQPSGSSDTNTLDPKVTYSASVNLQFADGSSVSNTAANGSTGVALGLGTSLASTLKTDSLTRNKALATADVLEAAPLQLKYVDSGVQLSSQNSPSDPTPASSFGNSQVYGSFTNKDTSTNSGWLAISQPRSSNAVSDPAGRVWINFAGAFSTSTNSQGNQLSSAVSDPAQAPTTWLNALAASNFSPNRPNLPLLNSELYQSSVGGLLIKADPSAGWGQNFGATMLVADVDNDGTDDLVIAAPQANGGGAVVIIDGTWIADNLTSSTGQTILDLSNPDNFGSFITVLRPGNANTSTDITTAAGFGTAIAFQGGSSGTAGTLWIGAPNYLRTLDASNVQDSTQPIGALYAYSTSAYASSWGSANPTLLSNPILGSSGTVTIPQAGNTSSTSWWGAQLGAAVAISSSGDLAVSAPGVVGAMVYTGTKAITDAYNNFDLNAKPELSSGLLYRLQLGGSPDATQGVDSPAYTVITGLQADNLSSQQKNFLTTFQNQMVTQVAGATMQNNQAIQAAAIGAVMVFNSDTNVASLGNTVLTATSVNSLKGRTYYGANPFNTLGDSGFGSSLSFADLTNSNRDQLIVGATQSGGGGLVYLLDPSATYRDNSLGLNQHVAVLAATNVVTAAEATDYLGSGLVNLGDVNGDQIDDVLIQAYNAASSSGNGYVLFGSDQLSTSHADTGLISLAPGSIGTIQYGNGTSSSLAILSELGSAGGLTGQGTYGPGDYNADGLDDIALGSGPNAKGYLTWGQPYLEAISDLQLSKLASDTGFLLDGLATTTQGSLRSIGDFNGDGYGDFISINPGTILTTVRIELGANTQEILAEAPYSYYTFSVTNGTEVLPGGDINGDGMDDIVLFLDQNLSTAADGNQGAGSTTGILYGRTSNDLPLGSGFGFIAPADPSTSAPLTPPPGLLVEGSDGLQGLTDATPSVIAVGNTLYAAVKGYNDNTLWFTQSNDGGSSWASWSELSTISRAFSTTTGPSLAYFNEKLYLGFVNSARTLSLSSWDPSSNNPLLWSTPSILSTNSGDVPAFSSASGPQLVDRGDSLGVIWMEDGSIYASSSTNPVTAAVATTPWAVVNGGASQGTPTLVRDGDTVYMAVQSGPNNSSNAIYWTSSRDGGVTWKNWQALPGSMTTTKPPSLAVVNGTLYLSYLGVGNNLINITSLNNATTNSWNSAYQIPGVSGTYASLTTETVAGTSQLAVYYVSNDPNQRILKSYTTTPASSGAWSSNIPIQYGNNSATQTSSGPLTVSQYNGQTYVAYQGGSAIIIATSSSSDINNGAGWSAQSLLNPGTTTGVGLSSSTDGLVLSYSNASAMSDLQLTQLAVENGSLNVFVGNTQTVPLPTTLSANIATLSGQVGGVSNLLLAGINSAGSGNSVQTSLVYPAQEDASWSPPLQLQQLQGSETTAIAASGTPSFTWLGTTAVLAVNERGSINVYAALGSGSSLRLASSFSAPVGGPSIVSAPVLASTDTGLVLTYTNSDGSISLNRLDLLSANGTPLPGVQLAADGSLDVSQAALQWQTTSLDATNSSISSSLASTPVSVAGNLLLANVRNASNPTNQIWLNAIANASDLASTTWLNTTVQLPDGNGGSILSQRAGIENSIGGLTAGTWQDVAGGEALSPVALTRNGDSVYMVVRGTTNNLYWNSSNDNGRTWNNWQGLPNSMGTFEAPSIAYFNNTLYICYVAAGSHDLNLSYLEGGNNWKTQYPIPGQSAKAAAMIVEGGKLAVYYIANDPSNRLLKSYSSQPSGTSWTNTSVLFGDGANQSASSNLALTRYNNQTYLAYQGGTSDNPSNTIYLATASDTVANEGSHIWNLLDTPSGIEPVLKRGVGLTSSSQGLVLTYTDNSQPQEVAVQFSAGAGKGWRALDDGAALSSSIGYTPLITADPNNQLLIAGMASNDKIQVQLNAINTQVLSAAQTGSRLTAVGDLNGDGYDDLVISANNVAYAPLGDFNSSDAQLTTGVRVVLGAATATAFSSANDANASQQTVQIVDLYRQPSSQETASSDTPLASLSGPSRLTLNGSQAGKAVQITSTESGPSLSDASLSASASDPNSLKQLFAGASVNRTSIPTSSTAQGTGTPSLQTLAGYGDLNADGYVDYVAPDGLQSVYSGDGAIAYDVWSIRAAGDVNGNGVDDVLLTLSPEETKGQWLQTALVDGALFHVENNQFSLAQAEGSAQTGWTTHGLKAPLNPYQYAYSENTPPGLQQWVQPILDYKPGNTLSDLTTGNATRLDSINSQPLAPDLNSTVGPDGTIYILNGIQADYNYYSLETGLKNSTSQLFYGKPDSPASEWQRAIVNVPNAGFLRSMVVYDGYLFANYYNSDTGIQSICSASLTTDLSNPSNWISYALSTPGSGQLVNEGDRLALYVCNSQGLLTGLYATSQATTLGGQIPSPITSTSWGGTLGDTGFAGPPVTINTVIDNSGSSAPLNAGGGLVATRFQGKTILAYYRSTSNQSNHTLFIAQADSDQSGSTFSSHATGLGTWYTSDSDSSSSVSSLHLAANASEIYLLQQNPFTASAAIQIVTGSSYKEWSNSVSWSNSNNTSPTFAASVSESALYLTNYLAISGAVSIAQADVAQSAPQQRSLAGYSIDGNIDINGDGFKDMLVSDPSNSAKSVDNQYALFGGDYLNIATQVGTDGNDVIVGTSLADVIYTIQGADQVSSNGGADVIYSAAGDDQISIIDNAFIRIDAGSGFDVLRLEGKANQSYDFRLNVAAPQYFAGTKLRDFELVSSQDYGANTIYLDAAGVNAINPDRILFLTPDSADSIILSPEFARNQALDTSYGGSLWHAYAAGPVISSTSNPTLVYVLVPAGNVAASWLSEQVIVGGQGLATLQSSNQVTAANEPEVDTGSTTEKSDPVLPTSSPVAGSSDFGEGLKLTAYRTNAEAAVANFCISRTDVSRSQIISYISSSRNSSADPGPHYSPVIGLVRLEPGEAKADITVPIHTAIAALRNGSVSLEVAELDDLGQKQFHLLLEVDHASNGRPPTLSGLNLDFDPESQTASIGFRADINKAARAVGLASTLNLNVLSRQSANSSTADLKNRVQKLALSEGVLAKFDQDGSDNGQVELQLDLNASTGAIQLQAAKNRLRPLLLSSLDSSKRPITLGIDLTTTSIDSVLLATPLNGVVLNETAVDFTVAADADGKAKIFLDLTQVAGDLEITETKVGAKTTRKPNHQLLYYGIDADGALSALTYNARRRAGARFYDIDGDSIADSVNLVFEDGGMGDTGPSGDGLIHDPSVGGVSNLTDVEWTAIDSRTLQAASRTNKDAAAALVVKVQLNSRSTSANQICYVAHDPLDSLSFDSIFADLALLKARSQTLYTSLESTDVTLASSTSLSREFLLINDQLVRFYEIVDGTLNTLSSANDARLRVFSTTGFSGDLRSVNAFSSSGVSLSLALVDGDQGLNALIGQEQGLAAVLDFTSFTTDQKVEGSLSLAREAAFDAVTGFYRTLDIKGTVWLDPLDKAKGTITPGQTGTTAADYGAAALRNMVDSLTGMRVDNGQTSSRLITLQESTYLAPIAQVNGHTFVSFEKGNTDGISHFVTLGTNTFGLEDLHGGGDNDYDDQIISLFFSKLVNPVV